MYSSVGFQKVRFVGSLMCIYNFALKRVPFPNSLVI
jgi:hypothetical protein